MVITVLITILLAPGAALLETDNSFKTMLPPDSVIFDDTDRYQEQFGGETIIVLIEGDLGHIFTEKSLNTIDRFEKRFAPVLDADGSGDWRIHSIIGPVTIIKLARQEAVERGILGPDDITNPLQHPDFINGVLYDGDSIRTEMAPLIPDAQHVLIQIRPTDGLGYEDDLQLVRDMEGFFASEENTLAGVESVRVVAPVEIMETIDKGVQSNLRFLLGICIVVMAVILLVMFRVKWNMLSLFMVGTAAIWTFGLMGYAGVDLCMTSMAVLPILIGIGIDYSIQFHNRFQEEVVHGKFADQAIVESITRVSPVVVIALISTTIGFITLFVAEVPAIQDFGKNLSVGVILSFLMGLFLLHSVIHLRHKKISPSEPGKASIRAVQLFERMMASGARFSIRYPLPILLIALILGIAGAVVDPWLTSKVDDEELMPQGEQTLIELRDLRKLTGYKGELSFAVTAPDMTSKEFLDWMLQFQNQIMDQYSDPERISMVNSPAEIVASRNEGTIPDDQAEIDAIFGDTLSAYRNQVLAEDVGMASLSFGLRHMPMEEVYDIKCHIMENVQLPKDVEMVPVGEMATAADAVDIMIGTRFMMNCICISAIFLVLLLVYRSLTRTLFTVLPAGLVIAWTSLVLYLGHIALNTMSAILGVLVIGIGVEFIVLLIGRYEEEKLTNGISPHDAMVVAVTHTGRAIVTTAATTLGGFGVLIASDFVMIRDFGITTTVSVFLCLLTSLLVMPPLVVWWDERIAHRLPKNL